MKKRVKVKDTGKIFATRRAAFRAAKRDGNIPVSMQPVKVYKPPPKEEPDADLDHRNRRIYIFEVLLGLFSSVVSRKYFIREDKEVEYSDGGKQMDHFNAGKSPRKLREHYYFKRR